MDNVSAREKGSEMEISAEALLYRLRNGEVPLILDVRTEEDFGQWKIECVSNPEEINIPYIEFIEEPEKMVEMLPKGREIVVVCAKGGASAYVADILRKHGFTAWNITGGMKAWGALYRRTAVIDTNDLKVYQFNRVGKGCLSYLIVADGEAAVIDSGRHIEQYLTLLVSLGAKLKYVIDTHLHADHISGAQELADATGAKYYISSHDMEGGKRDFRELNDDVNLKLGSNQIKAVALTSPGHTPGSTCISLNGELLFTGDTLFVSSLGRPDLGGMAEVWVKDLWNTVRKIDDISDDTIALPSHTAGVAEFDVKGAVGKTLGELRRGNELLKLEDEDEFSRKILANLPEEPEAYQKMRNINLGTVGSSDEEKDALELGRNRCAIEAVK